MKASKTGSGERSDVRDDVENYAVHAEISAGNKPSAQIVRDGQLAMVSVDGMSCVMANHQPPNLNEKSLSGRQVQELDKEREKEDVDEAESKAKLRQKKDDSSSTSKSSDTTSKAVSQTKHSQSPSDTNEELRLKRERSQIEDQARKAVWEAEKLKKDARCCNNLEKKHELMIKSAQCFEEAGDLYFQLFDPNTSECMYRSRSYVACRRLSYSANIYFCEAEEARYEARRIRGFRKKTEGLGEINENFNRLSDKRLNVLQQERLHSSLNVNLCAEFRKCHEERADRALNLGDYAAASDELSKSVEGFEVLIKQLSENQDKDVTDSVAQFSLWSAQAREWAGWAALGAKQYGIAAEHFGVSANLFNTYHSSHEPRNSSSYIHNLELSAEFYEIAGNAADAIRCLEKIIAELESNNNGTDEPKMAKISYYRHRISILSGKLEDKQKAQTSKPKEADLQASLEQVLFSDYLDFYKAFNARKSRVLLASTFEEQGDKEKAIKQHREIIKSFELQELSNIKEPVTHVRSLDIFIERELAGKYIKEAEGEIARLAVNGSEK